MTNNKLSVSHLNSMRETKKLVIEAAEFAYFPKNSNLTVGQSVILKKSKIAVKLNMI
jgi:hypothetical protein